MTYTNHTEKTESISFLPSKIILYINGGITFHLEKQENVLSIRNKNTDKGKMTFSSRIAN